MQIVKRELHLFSLSFVLQIIYYECHMRRRKKCLFDLQMENNFLNKNKSSTTNGVQCARPMCERNRSNQRIETEGDADGHD